MSDSEPESVYFPPKLPVVFPRTEWSDSEWWRLDTKWHKMAFAAHRICGWWLEAMCSNDRRCEPNPWQFKLAVFDRVHQINHQRRRVRQYTGAFATVEAWQEETDKITRLAFDEAELAFPPDARRTYPDFEVVRSWVRILMDHDYVQGKDAEPEFTATSDWDDSEYINDVNYPTLESGQTFNVTWPLSTSEADAIQKKYGKYRLIDWQHPSRFVKPDEWRPWKYRVYRNWHRTGDQWVLETYP